MQRSAIDPPKEGFFGHDQEFQQKKSEISDERE